MRKYLLSVAAFAAVMFALGGPAATPARAQAPTIDACEGLYMQCQYFMGHLVSWGSGCADLSLDGSAAAPNELGVVVDEMMCEDGTGFPLWVGTVFCYWSTDPDFCYGYDPGILV